VKEFRKSVRRKNIVALFSGHGVYSVQLLPTDAKYHQQKHYFTRQAVVLVVNAYTADIQK